ncbi:phosphoesterase, partial [Xanthomonas sp. Kuri4-1]
GLPRRWPAFWLRTGVSVLPAFSQFTAGVVPTLLAGEQLVACVEGTAIALPPARG